MEEPVWLHYPKKSLLPFLYQIYVQMLAVRQEVKKTCDVSAPAITCVLTSYKKGVTLKFSTPAEQTVRQHRSDIAGLKTRVTSHSHQRDVTVPGASFYRGYCWSIYPSAGQRSQKGEYSLPFFLSKPLKVPA